MVRLIGFLVGLVFAGVLLISLIGGVSDHFRNPPEKDVAHEFHLEPKHLALASDGPYLLLLVEFTVFRRLSWFPFHVRL